MSASLKKSRGGWLALATVLLVLVIVAPYIRQVQLAGAIQNAVERSAEITRNDSSYESVPRIVGDLVHRTVEWYGDFTHATPNERELYYDRLTAPFRSRQLHNLEIYDPKNFDGRLGNAIRQCRALRSVSVIDWGGWGVPPKPPESSWRSLCEALRELPRLETLELGGDELTDAALEPLAGHPTLRKISMERTGTSVTPNCARTFSSIPNLKELALGETGKMEDIWTEDAIARFRAALPGVTVTIER